MSDDMPVYPFDPLSAKLVELVKQRAITMSVDFPECDDSLFHPRCLCEPIRFTHEEEQWLAMMEELNRVLAQHLETLCITPDMIGETTNR